MNKEEFISILNGSFANGAPFIGWTQDYAYSLIPLGGGSYREISFDLHDKEVMEDGQINVDKAYLRFLEEMEKGLGMDIEDFMLVKFKQFKEQVEGKSSQDKLNSLVGKLMSEPETFSKNLPIIKNQGDLGRLIGLL